MRLAQVAAALATIATLIVPASRAAAQTQQIDFDGTNAPCGFSDTSPLTTQYAMQGVTFSGGGAILNQCGGFGFSARSGTDFLAFNTETYATGPEVFQFAAPISAFSIYAASLIPETVFTLDAFNAAGVLIGTSVVTPGTTFAALALTQDGISQVTLTSTAWAYAYDDLQFTAANMANTASTANAATVTPEPASFALLGVGLFGLAGAVRLRRAAKA